MLDPAQVAAIVTPLLYVDTCVLCVTDISTSTSCLNRRRSAGDLLLLLLLLVARLGGCTLAVNTLTATCRGHGPDTAF